jgi:hypothetical protein
MNRFTSALGLIAAAALASCATKPTPLTYEESASVRTTMRVEALNQGSRMITLRDSSGYSTTYHVSPDVARLNEVKVGDSVIAEYEVSVVGELRPPTAEEKADPVQIEKSSSRAPVDLSPAAATRRTVRIVTTVSAVDVPNMWVTLKGPMGDTTVVRARNSDNIKKLHVGDTIVINYVESSEISLVEAP